MSHLSDPMLPEDDDVPQDMPSYVKIFPPYTEHPPCGGPGCGRMRTDKWAEPVYFMEVRGISPTWGGLETAVTRICLCNKCYTMLGDLCTDAYMSEENKAVESLTEEPSHE